MFGPIRVDLAIRVDLLCVLAAACILFVLPSSLPAQGRQSLSPDSSSLETRRYIVKLRDGAEISEQDLRQLQANASRRLKRKLRFGRLLRRERGALRARSGSRPPAASSRRSRGAGLASASRLLKVEIDQPMGSAAVLESLQALPEVERVEPDYPVRALSVPNDPLFAQQWAHRNTGQSGGVVDADMDSETGWGLSRGDDSVVVAIVDSGVAYGHPDLAANMWVNPGEIPGNGVDDDNNGYVDDIHGIDCIDDDSDPVDEDQHGTHVAGIAAAVIDNGIGIAGVAGQARIMALRFLEGGTGFTSGAIECLSYAVAMGARVSNHSWGESQFSQLLFEAIEEASAAGHVFVAAAGNAATNTDFAAEYPAGYDSANVISVANSNDNDQLAASSNFGASSVDLAAPGSDIISTVPGGVSVESGVLSFSGLLMEGSARLDAQGPLQFGGLCDTPGDWSGAVVLCRRGDNTFRNKTENVQTGGGLAAVIFNNISGSVQGTLGPGPSSTVPSLSITLAEGEALLDSGLGETAAVRFDYGYSRLSGTSMAAPQVAGAVALLLSEFPQLSPTQVKQALLESVDRVPAFAGTNASDGRLNIANALERLGLQAGSADESEALEVPFLGLPILALGLTVLGWRYTSKPD